MPNQFTAWTNEERELLRKLVGDAGTGTTHRIKSRDFKTIAALFPNRTKNSLYLEIYRQRNEGELVRREYRPWTNEEILRLKALYSGNRWRLDLKGEFPDRESRDVLEKARRLGLSRRVLKTEAKELTSEQCAMMAGLLMADGSLSHRHATTNRKIHQVTINFSNTDPALVELFASMASNCRVREYKVDPNRSFKPTKLTHYECDINSKEAVKHTLKQILPYMVGAKLVKAREMLFCLEGGHQS